MWHNLSVYAVFIWKVMFTVKTSFIGKSKKQMLPCLLEKWAVCRWKVCVCGLDDHPAASWLLSLTVLTSRCCCKITLQLFTLRIICKLARCFLSKCFLNSKFLCVCPIQEWCTCSNAGRSWRKESTQLSNKTGSCCSSLRRPRTHWKGCWPAMLPWKWFGCVDVQKTDPLNTLEEIYSFLVKLLK